jgi:nitroreductase
VVLTARTDLESTDIDAWMERMAEVQGGGPESVAPLKGMIEGFAQAMSHEARHAWNIRQAYIALGQLMTSAAVLEIDTCPMEGLSKEGYDHILGLEGSGYATVVACALGYRAADDKYATLPKARFDRSRIISHI